MWNSVLCFFNETFLLTSVSCMSNFIDLKWGHFGERFNSLISIFAAFFALFLYPLLYLRFMRKNKDNFDEKTLKDKYGILYENLKYKKGANTFGTFLQPDANPDLSGKPDLFAEVQVLLDLRCKLPQHFRNHLPKLGRAIRGQALPLFFELQRVLCDGDELLLDLLCRFY